MNFPNRVYLSKDNSWSTIRTDCEDQEVFYSFRELDKLIDEIRLLEIDQKHLIEELKNLIYEHDAASVKWAEECIRTVEGRKK